MRIIINITIGALLLLTACSPENQNKEEEKKLSASLLVRYLEDNQELKGQALFFYADTSHKEPINEFPGGLSFMGSGTKARLLPGNSLRYEATIQAFYQNLSRFDFKADAESPITSLELEMEGLEGYSIEVPISLSKGGLIKIPQALTKQEQLVLLFTSETGVTRSLIIQGPTSSNSIVLETPLLANVAAGNHEVNALKKKNWVEEQEGMKVSKSVEYYALMKKVEVVE